jgi:hypothetical protein
MSRLSSGTLSWTLIAFVGAAAFLAAADATAPSKNDLSRSDYYLRKFESRVARARGQTIPLGYEGTEALKRVKALQEKFPNDPGVKALFERTRKALLASKGETEDVAANAADYRKLERKLVETFEAEAKTEWAAFMETVKASKDPILKAFPPPSHREVGIDELGGRYVVLEEFEYPTNEFTEMGQQYVFVGSGAQGYYFVELSNRAWIGAYEAVKRYRRFINQDVPEGMKWTLVGKISGIQLLVPQAGKKKTLTLRWGWTVEPVAIRVADRTCSFANPELKLGGTFAGEPRMEAIKEAFYTVKTVPKDATPEQVVETYITAIKEKNYPLYLACIDPARTTANKGVSLCMYHWEWHQHRFAAFYCQVKVGKAKVRVIKGFDSGSKLEDAFLTAEDKAKLKKVSGPLIEEAHLTTKAFNEKGMQYGSPKPRFLRRTDKGRWYIINYPQPF